MCYNIYRGKYLEKYVKLSLIIFILVFVIACGKKEKETGAITVGSKLDDTRFKGDTVYHAQIAINIPKGLKITSTINYNSCENYYLNNIKCNNISERVEGKPEEGYVLNFTFPKTEKKLNKN